MTKPLDSSDHAIGYVVVEYNQASGLPRVDSYSGYGGGDIYFDRAEAEEILALTRAEDAFRRETYKLAEIRLAEEQP